MSVKIVAPEKKQPYKVQPKAVATEYLAGPGSLRVQHLMYLFGCSYSTVFKRVKAGQLPAPRGHDPRPYWSNAVIRPLLGPTAVLDEQGLPLLVEGVPKASG